MKSFVTNVESAIVETYKLVMPENLNHFGYLFGGYMLKWVDEIAWIAATLDFPSCTFVTIGMDKIEFKRSVKQGTILRFHTGRTHLGRTSVTYQVDVTVGDQANTEFNSIFSTHVTMVRVDSSGNKIAIQPAGER
jgi:acyl-CoA hydrolase